MPEESQYNTSRFLVPWDQQTGGFMYVRSFKPFRAFPAVFFALRLPSLVPAGYPDPALLGQDPQSTLDVATSMMKTADIDIYIKGPDGVPVPGNFIVTLSKLNGKFYNQ